VQVHRFGIAGGQDQSRALAQFRADGCACRKSKAGILVM
jgi:hypothetical protein